MKTIMLHIIIATNRYNVSRNGQLPGVEETPKTFEKNLL